MKKDNNIYTDALRWAYDKQEKGFTWKDLQDGLNLNDQQMSWIQKLLRSNMPIGDNLVDHYYESGKNPNLLILTHKGMYEAVKYIESNPKGENSKNDKKEIARELWKRVNKHLEETVEYKQSPDNEKLNELAKRLRLTIQYFNDHSIEFNSDFQEKFKKLYFRGFQASLGSQENLKELHDLKDDFGKEVGKVINESKQGITPASSFTFIKDLKFHSGRGDNVGRDKTVETKKGKDFSETTLGKIFIGIVVVVVGGIILGSLTNWFGLG